MGARSRLRMTETYPFPRDPVVGDSELGPVFQTVRVSGSDRKVSPRVLGTRSSDPRTTTRPDVTLRV